MEKEIPAGLIAVKDLIDKHPSERGAILEHEISRRERERLLFRGTRKLLHLHVWSSVKAMLALGLTVFVLIWIVGQVAQIAQWFMQAQNLTLAIPVPLRKDLEWRLRDYLPKSSVLDFVAKIPAFDWQDALYIALAAMGLLIIEKIAVAVLTWKHASQLKDGMTCAEEELVVLREWAKETAGGKGDTVKRL